MLFNFVGGGGFEPPKLKAPDCDWRDVRYLDTSNISNQTHFWNGYVHYYSQAHLTALEPTQFFNLKYVKDHILKIRCKYTNNFLIFQIFFNIFFSHEKRNRTFITTIITTARRFTIKLPHGVILLTSMTSMQQRGLEPLHPVFTTGALPTELTDAPSLQEDINLKTFKEFYIAHLNVSDP